MNKIKILKDLLRLCTHKDSDHKPLDLSAPALTTKPVIPNLNVIRH